jgi:hypothetical protein
MMWKRYVGILVVLGMVTVVFGTMSAGIGIGAETKQTSVGDYPACTAPCECMSESTAAQRWGADGYEQCSKTICGQTADGMVQYYCLHQSGSTIVRTTKIPAITTTIPVTVSLETKYTPEEIPEQLLEQTPEQTQGQTQISSTEVPVNPSPSYTWPAANAVTQKSPVSIANILAVIGTTMLIAMSMRRK